MEGQAREQALRSRCVLLIMRESRPRKGRDATKLGLSSATDLVIGHDVLEHEQLQTTKHLTPSTHNVAYLSYSFFCIFTSRTHNCRFRPWRLQTM